MERREERRGEEKKGRSSQETEIRVFHARGSAETGEFDHYGRALGDIERR